MKREPQSSGIEELERRRLLSLTPVGTPTSLEAGAIAIAGNGDYIALHVSSKDHVLKAERYGSDGARKELMTAATFDDSIEGFNISMDDAGDAAVVCESGDSVYVVRISKDDVVSKLDLVAKTPDDPTAYDIEDTAISMDPAGGYFVGWTTGYTDTGALQATVQLQAFDSSGKSLAPQFTAASVNGGYDSFYDLSLAANPDGSGAVYAFTESIDGPEVYVNLGHASTSKAIGTTQQFEQADAPSVAVYPDNSFVIAYVIQQVNYSDDNPSQLGGGFVQRFDAQANPIGDPIDVGTDSKQFVVSVGVATLPDGGFVVGSLQTTNLTDLSDVPMDVRTYDASGTAEGSAATEVTNVDVETFNDQTVVNEFVAANDRGNLLVGDVETDDDVFEPPVNISMTIQQYENQDISLGGSVLNVVGTTANDQIDVSESDGTITVQDGTTVQTFKASDVSAISVAGLDGNDLIRNETAIPSTLTGGGGADTIYGGDGKDLLSGGGGNDRLYGGLGADHLYGAAGRDRLYGGGGNDYLEGGASGDWLYSQGGNDQMLGDGGDDRLYADYGSGDATLYGGTGDDSLVSADKTVEHLFGGSGDNSAEADSTDVLSQIQHVDLM